MKTIYFGVSLSENVFGSKDYIVSTSYTNDGYMVDSYEDEDQERLNKLYEEGIMVEAMESVFEVMNDNWNKTQIIEMIIKHPGFEYCEKLEYEEDEV